MKRETFIRKWLGNPTKQYNEQCRIEMRDDLDKIIARHCVSGVLSGAGGAVSGSTPVVTMKRAIKFRAWDESQKYMAYQGTPDLESLQSFIYHFGNKLLMQFTGLHDISGKEIYEGDIVKTNTVKAMVIGWSDRHASFTIEREGWAFRHYFGEAMEANECEIVGNVYENGDVLQHEAQRTSKQNRQNL